MVHVFSPGALSPANSVRTCCGSRHMGSIFMKPRFKVNDLSPLMSKNRSLITYVHFLSNRDLTSLAMGAPAARLFLQHRALMFPSTPLLITGADERTFNDIGLTSNDTAVASEFDQAKPIE